MTLDGMNVGSRVMIEKILNPEVAVMALRMGIFEGEEVEIAAKVPGGPIVVRRGGMEVALGRELTQSIQVYMV